MCSSYSVVNQPALTVRPVTGMRRGMTGHCAGFTVIRVTRPHPPLAEFGCQGGKFEKKITRAGPPGSVQASGPHADGHKRVPDGGIQGSGH